jgi:tetratricopeptide (TPR) repeat protein
MRTASALVAFAILTGSTGVAEEIPVRAGHNRAAIKLQNDGLTYENKGDYANARRSFDEAIRIDSTLWPAYFNRAALDIKEHKFHEAITDASMALRGKSTFNRSALLRAEANAMLGNYAEALRDFNTLINLGARGDAYKQALNDCAWLHATCPDAHFRNGRLAVQQATSACSLTLYKEASALDTLAAAYAETGDFDAATGWEQKALAINETPAEGMRLMRQHMTSFERRLPWRDTPHLTNR